MKINICAIVIGGKEKLLDIDLPNNFKFEKININNSFIKKRVRNLNEQLLIQYHSCCTSGDRKADPEVICITKEDVFTGDFTVYKEKQFRTIEKIYHMLKIYKEGDIEIYGIYYQVDNRDNNISEEYIIDINPFIKKEYVIGDVDVSKITHFINDNDREYNELESIIQDYCYSTKFISEFMQLQYLISITEMLIFKKRTENNNHISDRLSILFGKDGKKNDKIKEEFRRLNRLRNDSIHNGNNDNITINDVESARYIIREVIKWYIQEMKKDSSLTFQKIKEKTKFE